MFFIDDLTPLRVYPSNKKLYIPVNEKDKKHNAAIMLLSPNKENSVRLMNNSITINRRNYFSYFSDKSVEAIINHEGMIVQDDSDIINESNISPFDEVKKIVDSLSKEEVKKISNGVFKDSPNVIYRNVYYVNKIPVAFIDVYMLRGTRYGTIVMATNPKFRGKGYANELVSTMLDYFNTYNSMINELHWETQYDNIISINMAKKFNFNQDDNKHNKTVELIYNLKSTVKESKLNTQERSKLPDSEFGLPTKRKYPLNDKEHILSAVRMFNHVDEEDEAELAKNLKSKIRYFKMENEIEISKDNRFYNYTRSKKKTITESIIFKDDNNHTKFEFVTSSKDILEIYTTLNINALKELYHKLGNDKDAKIENKTIKIHIYNKDTDIPIKQDIYSIHCIHNKNYDSNKYGPYDLYLKNLLASLVIRNMNPNVNRYIESYVSIWMADQIDVFKDRSDVYWSGAFAVKTLYDELGVKSITKLIKTNNTTEISRIAAKYWIKSIKDLLPYQEKIIDNMIRSDILNEDTKDDLIFNTPEELHHWMKSHIKYHDFTKLMTPEEVLQLKYGSCHDQTLFVSHYLHKMKGIENIRKMFLIEYKEGSEQGGVTHSFIYYTKNKKVYWFENAWEGQKVIHGPYESADDIKKNILDHYKNSKMGNYNKFGKIEFSSFKGKPGMTLDEVVSTSLN